MLKREWPEKIATALGIPTVFGSDGPWISNGDTTDVSWFRAMCARLGIAYPNERIRAMEAIIIAVGGRWDRELMSSAGEGRKDGGNVRKEAFEELWSALKRGDQLPAEVIDPLGYNDALFLDAATALPDLERVLGSILRRRGQAAFRARLLAAYDWSCAITGCDLDAVLEAAHITPHSSRGTMSTSNGLLLRSDMHTLFDLGQIAIDTATWTVLAHNRVRASRGYEQLHGSSLSLPQSRTDLPDRAALDGHRRASGL